MCPIMAERKQGAGWNSGSSEAVHKANSDLFLRIVSYKLIIVSKKCQNCEMKVAGFHKALLGEK